MLKYSFTVHWGDTDAAGIVYYPNYYKWMDNATHQFFNEIGYSSVELFNKQKIGTPLLETHCEFFSPSFFGDELTVDTSVAEVRNKVFKMKHTFYRGDTILAEGYQVSAWTDFSQEKPKAIPIPDELKFILNEHKTEA